MPGFPATIKALNYKAEGVGRGDDACAEGPDGFALAAVFDGGEQNFTGQKGGVTGGLSISKGMIRDYGSALTVPGTPVTVTFAPKTKHLMMFDFR